MDNELWSDRFPCSCLGKSCEGMQKSKSVACYVKIFYPHKSILHIVGRVTGSKWLTIQGWEQAFVECYSRAILSRRELTFCVVLVVLEPQLCFKVLKFWVIWFFGSWSGVHMWICGTILYFKIGIASLKDCYTLRLTRSWCSICSDSEKDRCEKDNSFIYFI